MLDKGRKAWAHINDEGQLIMAAPTPGHLHQALRFAHVTNLDPVEEGRFYTLAQIASIQEAHAQEVKAAEGKGRKAEKQNKEDWCSISKDDGVFYAAMEVGAMWVEGIPPQEYKQRLLNLIPDTTTYTQTIRDKALDKACEAIRALQDKGKV